MVIAIDFDDTLMDRGNVPEGYRMGQPTPGAVEAVKQLVDNGHIIVIFTARNVQQPAVMKAVADWATYFKIPHAGITNIKRPEFEVIIDNRALRYTTWPEVLSDLQTIHI